MNTIHDLKAMGFKIRRTQSKIFKYDSKKCNNEVWVVKGYHGRDFGILTFIGSLDQLKKILREEGHFPDGYLIYSDKTWKQFHNPTEKKDE